MGFAGGIGFANIDLIYSGLKSLPAKGEEVYAKAFGMHLGGGIPATLINTSRLGIPSRVVTFIGHDYFSDFVRQEFARYPAEVIDLYEGDGMPVTLSSTMVCDNDRTFLSYRDPVEITPQIREKALHYLRGAKVVDMHEGFLDVYRTLKEEGTIHIFDTGWEDDLSIDKYREYLELADYYVPNQKEALKITGESTVEGAAECLSQFFSDVIIKLDKDGCLLKNKSGIKVIPPMEGVEAVDATGAGDAFLSGFIYGVYKGYPVEECLRFGNITGGHCVQGIGCLTKFVEEKELLLLAGISGSRRKAVGE